MKTIGRGMYEVNYRGRKKGEHGFSHNVRNTDRVLLESIILMSLEMLKPATDVIDTYYIGSKVYICREPEKIDTFLGWKDKGYHVKKGQKAITKIKLYNGHGWKEYAFFSRSQVTA